MKKILIADSSKASLVMTSEVFKDHYPGIQVIVAKTSSEAIALAKDSEGVEAFIIDFDLPDLNGAQTAASLKKLYKIPILITAFDRPDVKQSIESSLAKHADCQNWLKKPVNPEVVIAVAQRFCDGKLRVQKRVACSLPAFAEVLLEKTEFVVKEILPLKKVPDKKVTIKGKEKEKEKLKEPKKTKAQALKEAKDALLKAGKEAAMKSASIYFCGVIEDCSLSGVKLKPKKNNKVGLSDWNQVLASMETLPSGSNVTLKVPSPVDIESGNYSPTVLGISAAKKTTVTTKKTQASKKFDAKEKLFEDRLQSLAGKVVWTSSESGEWKMGIEFDNQMLSKQLFEAILSLQAKQQKNFQNQAIMKTSR